MLKALNLNFETQTCISNCHGRSGKFVYFLGRNLRFSTDFFFRKTSQVDTRSNSTWSRCCATQTTTLAHSRSVGWMAKVAREQWIQFNFRGDKCRLVLLCRAQLHSSVLCIVFFNISHKYQRERTMPTEKFRMNDWQTLALLLQSSARFFFHWTRRASEFTLIIFCFRWLPKSDSASPQLLDKFDRFEHEIFYPLLCSLTPFCHPSAPIPRATRQTVSREELCVCV